MRAIAVQQRRRFLVQVVGELSVNFGVGRPPGVGVPRRQKGFMSGLLASSSDSHGPMTARFADVRPTSLHPVNKLQRNISRSSMISETSDTSYGKRDIS